jgi:hypothetical protein
VIAAFSPAACYHIYDLAAGSLLDGPTVWSTRNICCRNEERFQPLERQWSFSMREIVFAGTDAEVGSGLALGAAAAEQLSRLLDLSTEWAHATDPFFKGSSHPKHLFQQVDPVKHELVYRNQLALASTNLHHAAIGKAFDICRADTGESDPPAVTGCVAFGLERWVAAVLDHHGTDPRRWPVLAGQRLQIRRRETPLRGTVLSEVTL